MIDILVIGVILLILGSAGFAVYRSRKKGKKCIGCSACVDNCHCCGYNSKKNERNDPYA